VRIGVSQNTFGTGNVSTYTTLSFSPNEANAWFLLAVQKTGSVNLGTVTDSLTENTWSIFTDVAWTDGTGRIQLWKTTAGNTTTNARVVTYDCTGDAATGITMQAIQVRQSQQAIVQSSTLSKNVAASTPAIAFPAAVQASNGVLIVLANLSNGANVTAPTGYVRNVSDGYSTPTSGGEICTIAAGETNSNVTFGGTSASSWYAIGFEIQAAPDGTNWYYQTPTNGYQFA
jgi:hypothetical protein